MVEGASVAKMTDGPNRLPAVGLRDPANMTALRGWRSTILRLGRHEFGTLLSVLVLASGLWGFIEVADEWQTVIVRGDPRTALLAETLRRRADLLAVGTHGRAGIAHALVGSVAEWVIQNAACDVLVARPVRVSFELP
jgi:hypothetical protein